MASLNCKALVAGVGPSGLAAAALLAKAGIDVICVAPAAHEDPRTVALMDPSLKLLAHLGVWPARLESVSNPLKRLHIIDDTGNMVSAPTLKFAAQELGLQSFGWNIPLAHLIPRLREAAQGFGVHFIESKAASARLDDNHIIITLENAIEVQAQIAVAADGVQSVLRKAAGIEVEPWSFDQDALVTQFTHSAAHQDVSTEWHKRGGPFTTVPMPGHRSSLVWMDKPAAIDKLMTLSPDAFAAEIQLQNHSTLGLISKTSPPRSFAMKGIKAKCFAAARTLLVGEAAHVFPPIGAQGLNMSLRDAAFAAEMIVGANDPGALHLLAEYDLLRRNDVGPRNTAINLMNRTLLSELVSPHLARVAGLTAVATFPMLRGLAMQQGLAPTGNLPLVMR